MHGSRHWGLVDRKTHPSSVLISSQVPGTPGRSGKGHVGKEYKISTPPLSLGTKHCCEMLSLFCLGCSHKEKACLSEFHKVRSRVHRNLLKCVIWIYMTGGSEKIGSLSWDVSVTSCWAMASSALLLKKPHEENCMFLVKNSAYYVLFLFIFVIFFPGNGSVGLTYCKSVSLLSISQFFKKFGNPW